MQRPEISVLFTSVGRRVELLRAFRRAYADEALSGKIVATDVDPLAPALRVADKAYLVPRSDNPAYVPALLRICEKESADLVFPLIDGDIPILAENRKQFTSVGARAVVVDEKAALATGDKWRLSNLLMSLGIPAPKTWLGGKGDIEEREFPLVVKPRFGSAGKNVLVVRTEEELQFFLRYVSQPIVQEFVGGTEVTNDVVCDFDGEVLAVVSRERIEVRWGEVAKGRTILHRRIVDACVEIARSLNAIGPITVQCILREGEPLFTEINARFGGGAPLGFAAGVDSPRYLLALAAGRRPDAPPLGTYKVGLYLTRYDNSYFLEEPCDGIDQSSELRFG
jgi:carbamoyl-phosphate synthase large subunit